MSLPISQKKNTSGHSFFSTSWPLLILFIAWALMQLLVFYHFGLVTTFEAGKYINEAFLLLKNGRVSSPNRWLYSTQIFLIAAGIKLKTGFFSVALVQWLFNLGACYFFYQLCARLGNRKTSFILTLFLVLNYPLQVFNSSLQTESLFYSLTLLFSCFLLQISILSVKNLMGVILFLLLICFTRPTGLLFVPCSFFYLLFRFPGSVSILSRLAIATVAAICFLFFLNLALGSGGSLDLMLPFRDENIICGVPGVTRPVNIQTSAHPNSIVGLLYYITHNTGQFMKLAILRSGAFFGLMRSYYSTGHNIYLALYFFPFYIAVILSLGNWVRKNRFLLLYCSCLILINWMMVCLTCDDWHNRFFLTIVPYICMLSIPALQKLTVERKNETG